MVLKHIGNNVWNTDTAGERPTGVPVQSTLLEVPTRLLFIYNGTTWDLSESAISPYTWLIYKQGSNYKAKNGYLGYSPTNGISESLNTTWSYIAQNFGIGGAPDISQGGRIILGSGIFTFTTLPDSLYMIVIKCVKQNYTPNDRILDLMETFRKMVNDCIQVGLENNETSFISLQRLCYHTILFKYNILSHYKLCAIKRAAGILCNCKKSIRRGFKTNNPFTYKPQLVWCLHPKVERRLAIIRIPVGNRQSYVIPLTRYAQSVLFGCDLRIHSFTLSANNTVSIAYSKNVEEIECNEASGLDRNLDNVAYGNSTTTMQYNVSKATSIASNTKKILSSFRRNDRRICKRIFSKYGRRRKNRVSQLLHGISKHIVATARENRHAIVFEDIRNIRNLHREGNGQGRNYRGKMNTWPDGEIKRQIQYKAQWSGIPIIQLTINQTYGTSSLCGICGKRT
jgi:putative transposase